MAEHFLVTGGSGDIGAAIVKRLCEQGYEVTLTYNRSSEAASELKEKVLHQGRHLSIWQCDLADEESVESLCAHAESMRFNGFVHCASLFRPNVIRQIDVELSRRVMEISYWSFISIVKSLLPSMRVRRKGRIIALGSIAANYLTEGVCVYASVKSALESLCSGIAVENGAKGVTVNCVSPGYVDTQMLEGYSIGELAKLVPNRRLATPEEVAAAVAFLISDESGYINGSTLTIDGGLTKTGAPLTRRQMLGDADA